MQFKTIFIDTSLSFSPELVCGQLSVTTKVCCKLPSFASAKLLNCSTIESASTNFPPGKPLYFVDICFLWVGSDENWEFVNKLLIVRLKTFSFWMLKNSSLDEHSWMFLASVVTMFTALIKKLAISSAFCDHFLKFVWPNGEASFSASKVDNSSSFWFPERISRSLTFSSALKVAEASCAIFWKFISSPMKCGKNWRQSSFTKSLNFPFTSEFWSTSEIIFSTVSELIIMLLATLGRIELSGVSQKVVWTGLKGTLCSACRHKSLTSSRFEIVCGASKSLWTVHFIFLSMSCSLVVRFMVPGIVIFIAKNFKSANAWFLSCSSFNLISQMIMILLAIWTPTITWVAMFLLRISG